MEWVVWLFWVDGAWRQIPEYAPMAIQPGRFSDFVDDFQEMASKAGPPIDCDRMALLLIDENGDRVGPLAGYTLHVVRDGEIS